MRLIWGNKCGIFHYFLLIFTTFHIYFVHENLLFTSYIFLLTSPLIVELWLIWGKLRTRNKILWMMASSNYVLDMFSVNSWTFCWWMCHRLQAVTPPLHLPQKYEVFCRPHHRSHRRLFPTYNIIRWNYTPSAILTCDQRIAPMIHVHYPCYIYPCKEQSADSGVIYSLNSHFAFHMSLKNLLNHNRIDNSYNLNRQDPNYWNNHAMWLMLCAWIPDTESNMTKREALSSFRFSMSKSTVIFLL